MKVFLLVAYDGCAGVDFYDGTIEAILSQHGLPQEAIDWANQACEVGMYLADPHPDKARFKDHQWVLTRIA